MDMDTTVIEILDETLSQIYYHQENFTQPTRLVFPNLTTVLGSAYFHQNVNLVSVDFPQLKKVDDYVYFHQNTDLEYVKAPVIDTIYNYLYANGNTALTEFDFCSLTAILPPPFEFIWDIPYYFIANNTPLVDATPFCFTQGAPENLDLSNTSIAENEPSGTYLGTLSATGNYAVNTFIYYLTEDGLDNDHFEIVNDSLRSKSTFDFEVKDEYLLTIGVFNQLGETHTGDFTINIEDLQNEGVQIIEILDDTLSQVYYHQENFTQPTRLFFPNLTTVLGSTYFHQNVNLISVDFPQLNKVGDYVYFHQNTVMEYMKAPVIDTIYNYLYANGHPNLTQFDVCSLSHIIADMDEFNAYYYFNNNPLLDLTTTCLDTSILQFVQLDSLLQSENIQVGTFETDASNDFLHYINIGGEEVTETNEFIIIDDGLYLTMDLSYYEQNSYTIEVSSYKLDDNPASGVNERILSAITLDLADETVITSLTNLKKMQNILVYPNPASTSITIVLEVDTGIKLINPLGKIIVQQKLSKGTHQIDLGKYDNGLYFLNTEFGQSIKISRL